jgi:hypothetical protein
LDHLKSSGFRREKRGDLQTFHQRDAVCPDGSKASMHEA